MVCIGPCEKCVSGFHISASEHLARLSSNLKVDGRVVPIEDIGLFFMEDNQEEIKNFISLKDFLRKSKQQ